MNMYYNEKSVLQVFYQVASVRPRSKVVRKKNVENDLWNKFVTRSKSLMFN